MDTLDHIALAALTNFDRILLYSPYSSLIEVKRIEKTGQFGYEKSVEKEILKTVGIIRFHPERSFLKKIGIFTEDDLPIIGLFPGVVKLKKGDIVTQYLKDFVDGEELQIKRTFEIVDMKSYGDLRTAKKVFVLAPLRG